MLPNADRPEPDDFRALQPASATTRRLVSLRQGRSDPCHLHASGRGICTLHSWPSSLSPKLNAESNRKEMVWRVDVGGNPVDPPGSCGSLGRRKLELVGVGGPSGGSILSTLQLTALRGLRWAPQSPAMKYIIVAKRWQRKCGDRRPRALFEQGLAMLVFEHADVGWADRSKKSAALRAQQLRSKLCERSRTKRRQHTLSGIFSISGRHGALYSRS